MVRTLANTATNLKRRARYTADALPSLWLLTDETRLMDPAKAIAELPRGCGVILRHYAVPHRAALARTLALACKTRGLVFLVAGDWRLADQVNADGVHLPESLVTAIAPGARIWRRTKQRVFTAAAHGPKALRAAGTAGIDAALLGPVFTTRSHPGATPLGRLRFARLSRESPVPVIALGGVNLATVRGLNGSGCAGIAGIGFARSVKR